MRKKVIVTGGSGYIGSEVVSQLLKRNYDAIIIDIQLPQVPLDSRVEFFKYDLRRPFQVKKTIKNVEYLIHLAARVGGISFANRFPASILSDNTLIDINAIDLAKELSVKRFSYASSSLIYEKSRNIPYSEDSSNALPSPHLSYGFAKMLGEKLCETYLQEYELPFTVCRLFNVYGVNSLSQTDPHGHVIPDLIKKIISDEYPLLLLGDGNQTRHFTHVKDVAEGILDTLTHTKGENEIYNIAGTKPMSILQISEILWRNAGRKEKINFSFKTNNNIDVEKSWGDTKKIRTQIGWNAKVSYESGFKELIDYYSNTKPI